MRLTLYTLLLLLLVSCQSGKEQRHSTIFGTRQGTADEELVYDLHEIRDAGVLIGVTLSGPDTYYEYRGEGFGLQYRMAQEFASSIGATLQMEIASDTASMLKKLEEQQADFVCIEMEPGQPWLTRSNTPLLREAIDQWWDPSRAERLRRQTSQPRTVRRRSRPVMQDRAHGVISPYDNLFLRYSGIVGWDWRLLAAQCYQESGFDPKAQSWAGAQGLMQLMPATAAQLGVSRDKVFDPETNIAAAAQYLKKITAMFPDITDPSERIAFVLASYNGGYNHVRDAMALASKHGSDEHRWRNVAPYILRLSDPAYYRDPVVRYGYLRGSETDAYVRQTLDRWRDYRGAARPASASSLPAPSRRSLQNGTFRSRVKTADEWVPEAVTDSVQQTENE